MSATPKFDLKTSEGGRGFIANLFVTVLRRHDFTAYIKERLAADFACALSQLIACARARESELQQRLTAADERADVLEGALRTSLLAMKRIYQAGYDRIIEAGGTSDTPEYMMASDPTTRELRALLVAKPETVAGHHPACRTVDDYKPGDCRHSCKPAAQPQGEPVAWCIDREEPGHLGGYCSAAMKESGVGFQGHTKPLYAEQPAPVAVAPERLDLTDGLRSYEYVTGHNAAIDKMRVAKS